jgi:hypothetical protein
MQYLKTWNPMNKPARQVARLGKTGGALAVLALGLAFWPSAHAQAPVVLAQPLIIAPINEANRTTLPGHVRHEARNPANDRGMVADSLPMHMHLQLRRPAAQEQAVETLIDQIHDPNSPNYHHWLTPDALGAQFGPAATDIAQITGWLQRQGFTVDTVHPNQMMIDYSGTAGQVRTAFHTEIHNLSVNGVAHIANMTDPQVPAALAPALAGIVALNDFRPHAMAVHRPEASPEFTRGSNFFVSPPDLETIYNLNPLFATGHTGQGQTIYLLEDSDIYTNGGAYNDWTTFRTGFGIPVSSYPGTSLTTIHPNCADPGTNGDDAEAIIDAEYASASAPSAAIVMVVCNDFVGALQTLFNNQATYPPDVLSISYGDCEADNGAGSNAAYNSVYQTGVAEGWSIFVSAGDQGAGGCDAGVTVTHGIGVNGLASTPYNVAVGGTDYGDTYAGTNSTYWNSTNSASNGSAKSYIPEIPWNSTCGSQLFATSQGYATTYGTTGFCNSSFIATTSSGFYLENWAGSGGPSGCATGSVSVTDVVSGSCAGWPKPTWQSGFLGNPNDHMRDLPDVSMFASFDPWRHSYAICYSDVSQTGGTICNGTASHWSYGWGGTSFASPIWAGIQALVNQYTGSTQGNPNPTLYKLAAAEYGATGSTACNSSNGNSVGSSCIFYDVTLGDNDAPCQADSANSTLYNCYLPSGTYGVLSTNNNTYVPAFTAGTGWDFATGIGTVNVYNLVTNWASTGGTAQLTVSVTGSGTVTSIPSGISCPSTCSASFATDTQVTLSPTPAGGWAFSGWSGACTGNSSCTVTMNSTQSVIATFVQSVTLSVSVSGSGTVTSSPSGINCGSTCSANFAGGSQVTLTATPVSDGSFSGWGGACSGTGSCVVTMNSAQSVTATFAQVTYTLSVSVSGNGTVTSSPSGISCGSMCTADYPGDSVVTLTATPAGGATFNGWGGACSGTGSCNVTMNSEENVTAMFSASGGGSPSSQTWVSATLGNDSNPCTRAAPCLTFAVALANTTAGGEIDVLDPGDFGPVTINKAISIYNDAVGVTGILTPSGQAGNPSGATGIMVSAGANDLVSVRGIIFNGSNQSGTSGISFTSGAKLEILNCVFQGFGTSGMTFSPGTGSAATAKAVIQDTMFLDNAAGILIKPTSGVAANVSLNHVHADKNTGTGVQADGTGGTGTIEVDITDSTASLNAGNGISAISGPANVTVNIMRAVVASNGSAGLQANQSGGGTASVTVGSSQLYGNTIAAQSLGSGSVLSYLNNQVTGNGMNGTFTGTASVH